MFVEKRCRKYTSDVKVIPWEPKLRLVVVDLEKSFIKVVRKE